MDLTNELRLIFAVGPVAALLLLGLWLALRSGVATLSTGQGVRRLMENLSEAALFLIVSVIALVALQQFIGFQMVLAW